MPETPIEFLNEDVDFVPAHVNKLKTWIVQIIVDHGFILENLTYIFCSDEYLLQLNNNYLNHDTLTDIITFDNADVENTIEGDIFISIDRVKENALILNQTFEDELHRVLIHGVLHLLGYSDKSEALAQEMRAKEDYYLSLRKF